MSSPVGNSMTTKRRDSPGQMAEERSRNGAIGKVDVPEAERSDDAYH